MRLLRNASKTTCWCPGHPSFRALLCSALNLRQRIPIQTAHRLSVKSKLLDVLLHAISFLRLVLRRVGQGSPAPLRTVRASSPHTAQAPQRPIRDRPGCPYWTSFAILAWQAPALDQPEEGAHRRVVEPPPSPICFPRLKCSPYALAKRHPSDVGSLSCRVTLKPVSAPLQDGIRFLG